MKPPALDRRLLRPFPRLLAVTALALGLVSCARSGATVAPGPWPAQLGHASTPETHRQAVADLFIVLHMEEQLRSGMDLAMNNQMLANPNLRPFEAVMRKFMTKYLTLDAIREPMTRLYMDRFSELEIVQIANFYRTPLGQRSVAEVPKLMEEGSNFGRQLVQDHMGELQDMIREQIERDAAAAPAPAPESGR